MLTGLVEGLILAWILVQFNVDDIFIEVLQPFIIDHPLTTSHFYFGLGLVGLITGLLWNLHQ